MAARLNLISPLFVIGAITQNGVRLYDLDFVNGTLVDVLRIQVADLEERSTFRIGSTEFVVWIAAATSNHRLGGR